MLPAGTAANGVRNVGAERDTTHAVTADRLLLGVDRFAFGVVAGDVNRATAACRTDAIARHVAVASQHEHVVAQGLKIVAGAVSSHVTVVVQLGRLDVGTLRQVTTEATRVPRTVAGNAGHVLVAVGTAEQVLLGGAAPSDSTIVTHSNRFGGVGSRIVIRRAPGGPYRRSA